MTHLRILQLAISATILLGLTQCKASASRQTGTITNMRVALRILIVIVLPLLVLTGCFDKYVVRQKVTVSVETPAGQKTASSVEEISYSAPLLKGPAAGFDQATITRTGEAVVMEVAPGRYLFALLSDRRDPWNVFFPGEGPQATIEKFGAMIGQTRELSSSQYPLLVTFDDINDPASVKRVDPANLEATFGPGYRLNGITLSLTKEPVTKGEVEKVLGWLGPYPEPKLSPPTGRTTDIPFSRKVSHGDFIRR